LRNMGRYNYTTPTSYLELLKLLLDTVAEQRAKQQAEVGRYEQGVSLLDDCSQQVALLQTELTELQPKLVKASRDTDALMESLKLDQKKAEETRKVSIWVVVVWFILCRTMHCCLVSVRVPIFLLSVFDAITSHKIPPFTYYTKHSRSLPKKKPKLPSWRRPAMHKPPSVRENSTRQCRRMNVLLKRSKNLIKNPSEK
jgi:hypothetical protein